jgi:hypothetical protein
VGADSWRRERAPSPLLSLSPFPHTCGRSGNTFSGTALSNIFSMMSGWKEWVEGETGKDA